PDVAEFDKQVLGDLALDVEVVLVGDRGNLARVEEADGGEGALAGAGGAEGRVERRALDGGKPIAEAEDAQEGGLRNHEAGSGRETGGGDVPDGIADGRAVEDARAPADHGVTSAGKAVGEARAGSEVVPVGREGALGDSVAAGESDDAGRAGDRVEG